jgi:hypothetical protein
MDPGGNKSSTPEEDKGSEKRKKEREETAKQVRTAEGSGKAGLVRDAIGYVGAKAIERALKYARQRGVEDAWKMEKQAVGNGFPGSRNWTMAERRELLETGKVKGYDGDHINTVNGNPELAADHSNIQFLTEAEHKARHKDLGGTKIIVSGQTTIDRTFGGQLPDLATDYAKGWGDKASEYGLTALSGVAVGLEVIDYADPIFGPMGILGGANPGCQTLDCNGLE